MNDATSNRPADKPGGRRRGAVLERAILDAAAAELGERGYLGMTMDRVASRAGTNKNAIYRRWPSRAALGVAVYRRSAASAPATPDLGSLRADATALLRRTNETLSSPDGALLRDLLSAAGDDPEVLALLRDASRSGAVDAAWLTVIGRAVARGEAPPEAVHPSVAALPTVVLRGEYARRGTVLSDEALVEFVDEVLIPLVRGRGVR